MVAILFRFPMVLDKIATILFKTEHHRKTLYHWKTEQSANIGIHNMFGIPAPNVQTFLSTYMLDKNLDFPEALLSRSDVELHPGKKQKNGES